MKSVMRIMSGSRRGWSSGVSLEDMMMRIISRGSSFVGLLSCNGGAVERFRGRRFIIFCKSTLTIRIVAGVACGSCIRMLECRDVSR